MRHSPLRIAALILGAALAAATAAPAITLLDWSTVPWAPGDLVHTYTFGPPDNVDLTIDISSTAAGSFTTWNGTAGPTCLVATPGKDGTGQSTNFFGTLLDLGVIFEPSAGVAGSPPVLIKLKFTNAGSGSGGPRKAVANFHFEISDIDTAAGGSYTGVCNIGLQGQRRDQVVITADNSGTPVTAFTLTPKTASPTFSVAPFNTATATDPLVATTANDNGNVIVNFGSSFVTDVLITYNENAFNAVSNPDPGFRGIGILGNAQFPVELIDFTVE